jgi:hypothetical protein
MILATYPWLQGATLVKCTRYYLVTTTALQFRALLAGILAVHRSHWFGRTVCYQQPRMEKKESCCKQTTTAMVNLPNSGLV